MLADNGLLCVRARARVSVHICARVRVHFRARVRAHVVDASDQLSHGECSCPNGKPEPGVPAYSSRDAETITQCYDLPLLARTHC